MKPSFFALFDRGRYHRNPAAWWSEQEDDASEQTGRDRKEGERFAAAAIAFCFRHDHTFRRRFWQNICRVNGDPPLTTAAEILVEPFQWADLSIINPTKAGRYVYVVECKIRAKLFPIQNPSTKDFGGRKGYGSLLNAHYSAHEGEPKSFLRYIVLGWPHPLATRPRLWSLPITIKQKCWESVRDDCRSKTPLVKDLFSTLGMLGILAFPLTNCEHMKINRASKEIEKAVRVLVEARRRIGLRPGHKSQCNFEANDEEWALGFEINKSNERPSRELAAILKPPQRWSAWVGYQADVGHHTELAVWLYCGSKNKQSRVVDKLKLRFPEHCLKIWAGGHKWFCICVKVGAQKHASESDCDWFVEVFNVLGLKNAK